MTPHVITRAQKRQLQHATETTLTILEIIKEKKRKENRAKKEETIHQMAMELKKKQEMKRRETWL